MIAVVDCEGCRTRPIMAALEELEADARLVSAPEPLERADKIILPPSLSYRRMLGSLRDRGLAAPLIRAIESDRPILGIGGGLNVLFDVSYEDQQDTGLGVVHGKVTRFDFGRHPASRHFSVPHQGWNQVHWAMDCALFEGLESGAYFYFDHCVHPEPLDRRTVAATTNHCVDFTSVIHQKNIYGTVFFPERSDSAGRTMLRNFVQL
ncbi:MAG: imidazole glycerol phosphate synthase subunit HisH [Phycisphaerales bacterium]|nr:imidazole glycerol phosphate synthase subunit HisH [Phycisphaerales bacterium]